MKKLTVHPKVGTLAVVLPLLVVGVTVALSLAQESAAIRPDAPMVGRADRFGVSPPLHLLRAEPLLTRDATEFREIPKFPLRPPPPGGRKRRGGTTVPPTPLVPTGSMPTPLLTFEGLSNLDNIAVTSARIAPPDPNGDVGLNHYVQFVNILFRAYDKSGAPLTAPLLLSQLYAGVGGFCASHDNGDPIVLYDAMADRWFLSELAFDRDASANLTPPFHQCIAISQTGDPTGAYFLYDFQMPNDAFNDYPHFGVWPDAYYMTDNQFDGVNANTPHGAGAFAFDRAKMLAGDPTASYLYFDLFTLDPSLDGMLPSSLNGPPPPAGEPAYFMNFTSVVFGDPQDGLRVFEFHADFVTPANSTFIERPESPIAVDAFDPDLCGGSQNCIPQPFNPLAKLDPIADRLMHRLQYRNFGNHESLVTNHTVDVDGTNHAGVRYYEVRRSLPDGAFFVNEQGTFAPDSDHRWMGSAAMDRAGNLAVGYSVSGQPMTFPSIRYAGRTVSDPPGGLFQAEATLQAGSGIQTSASKRWGDYTMLGVDPVDDCTFWYTNQYYSTAQSSTVLWQTRVGSFRFDSCAPPSGTSVFLHGAGGIANPPTLFLDTAPPAGTRAKYRDSDKIKFAGGNQWEEIGTWRADPFDFPDSNSVMTALQALHVWLGLRNSDDQGTKFDLKVEVLRNGVEIGEGLLRCISGVARAPVKAKAVVVSPVLTGGNQSFNGTTDTLSVSLSTRIGTNADDTKCAGSHKNAKGLRAYFDAVGRDARLDAVLVPAEGERQDRRT